MYPGQDEPAVRLPRIDVFQKEHVGVRRLLLRLVAKAALPNDERRRVRRIAGAFDGHRGERTEQEEEHPHADIILGGCRAYPGNI